MEMSCLVHASETQKKIENIFNMLLYLVKQVVGCILNQNISTERFKNSVTLKFIMYQILCNTRLF
jgi:hypothetical protein